MLKYPEPISRLNGEFKKMPGIGPKSAQRLSLYVIGLNNIEAEALTNAIIDVKKNIKRCSICNNLTVFDPCDICGDNSRDKSILCVVSDPKDLLAIEKTGFKGLYHVIGGVISPLDGIRAEDLKIHDLLKRLSGNSVKEIIVATNPTVEGETTALYLTKLIKPLGVKITRIASGLPVGSDMDFADEITISKSFEGRREIE